MAIYHLTAKVISRGKGQSAIAAAAYRSGERLRDEQAGEQKYYTSRAERIQFTDIMAPADAPEWAHDRNQLWNHAERAEKRKDAQLAREFEVSLPHELTEQQREWLVKDFAREAFVRKGYAVDIAIHAPDGMADERNFHAHLMVTMREIGPDGFAAKKDRSLNSDAQLTSWREQWAHLANRHLERHGHEERIDHRSLKEQGIDREATIHLGYAASAMAERGAQSDRMDALREILARNEIRVDLRAMEAELKALERQAAAQQREEAERASKAAAAAQQAEAQRQQEAARERAAAEKMQAARVAAEKAGTARPATPIEQINAGHAAAEAERQRVAAARAAEEQAFGFGFQHTSYGLSGFNVNIVQPNMAQPPVAKTVLSRVEERGVVKPPPAVDLSPGNIVKQADRAIGGLAKGVRDIDRGLRVIDRTTGSVVGLGSFVLDFLAGAPAPAARVSEGFTMDPAQRKAQQLQRAADREAAARADKALESMAEDLREGRALKSEDIKSLTRPQQEQIRLLGDAAVTQMVEEAQKRAKEYWQGRERERD